MPTEFFLLGAGGHGKVVLDALYVCGKSVQLFDSDTSKNGMVLLNNTICELPADSTLMPKHGHVSIGNNEVRRRVSREILAKGITLSSVLHPRAIVSESAGLADGCFIAAAAIVGPDALLAEGCIVNHSAVIDHDVKIACYCHVAPKATLGGGVVLGEEVLIGSGAVVLPGIKIGDRVKVGAGAVVTRDVQSGQIVTGVPARSRA